MNNNVFKQLLHRPTGSYKYSFGHVLVIGGSPGMVGAPLLVGEAALRVGAGLVTIASSTSVIDKLEKRVREIMTLTLPEDSSQALTLLRSYIQKRKVSVLVIGPGLNLASSSLTKSVIKSINLPIVIDGGGLTAFKNNLSLLDKSASKQLVLTPHSGEFHDLCGELLPNDRNKLKTLVENFVRAHPVTLVLKGHSTLIAHSGRKTYQNTSGGPGLATAGTGDVLAGVIAGIIAQRVEIHDGVEAAVYLHGLAGDIATKKMTEPGVIASDVIRSLPAALHKIRAAEQKS